MLNLNPKKIITNINEQNKKDIMKYMLLMLLSCAVCTMFCLCSCQKENIHINKEESFYSKFNVENGKVYIYCTLLIENFTETEKNIALMASFEDDVKNGLLKETIIDGYTNDGDAKIFQLQKGKNQLDVVFIGQHAGGYQKHDRTLPKIK